MHPRHQPVVQMRDHRAARQPRQHHADGRDQRRRQRAPELPPRDDVAQLEPLPLAGRAPPAPSTSSIALPTTSAIAHEAMPPIIPKFLHAEVDQRHRDQRLHQVADEDVAGLVARAQHAVHRQDREHHAQHAHPEDAAPRRGTSRRRAPPMNSGAAAKRNAAIGQEHQASLLAASRNASTPSSSRPTASPARPGAPSAPRWSGV